MIKHNKLTEIIFSMLIALALMGTGCSGSSDDDNSNTNGDADAVEQIDSSEIDGDTDTVETTEEELADLTENTEEVENIEYNENVDINEQEYEIIESENELDGDIETNGEEGELTDIYEENTEAEDSTTEQEIEEESSNNIVETLPANIPDADENGIVYQFDVSAECAHSEQNIDSISIRFTVNITHPEIGDLTVKLINPNNEETTIYDQENSGSGGSFEYIYDTDINELNSIEGTWSVQIIDHVLSETGTLDSVEYNTTCTTYTTDGDMEESEYAETESTEDEYNPSLPYEMIVYSTDFTSGGEIYAVQFNEGIPFAYTTLSTNVHTDTTLHTMREWALVIERMGKDDVFGYNGFIDGQPEQQFEISVGNGSLNAQDAIYVNDSKIYITRYASNEILIVNPATGNTIGTIDVSSFADESDGLAEPSRMVKIGDIVFVQIQALDSNNYFAPSGTSWLLPIDSRSDSLVDLDSDLPGIQGIRLPEQNPFGKMVVYNNNLYVNLAKNAYAGDGETAGIWKIDLTDFSMSSAPIISEDSIGGGIIGFTISQNGKGLAIISTPSYTTKVVGFNIEDGSIEPTAVYDASAWDVNDVSSNYEFFFVATNNGIKSYSIFDFSPMPDYDIQLPEDAMPPHEMATLPGDDYDCIDDNTCTGNTFCDLGRCVPNSK